MSRNGFVPSVIFPPGRGRGRPSGRRWMRRRVAATALLAGCAGLPVGLENPDVHLERAVVRGVGLTGGTMDLIVGVYNPNHFDLAGTRLQVGFDVEQSHVGDVTYDSKFQMQQGDTTALTLPLQFTWSGLADAARTALRSGELPYTLKGQLSVETPVGEQTIPFTREGRAPLSRVAGAVVPGAGQ
jgi:LEA14-like dessication related protein